METNGTGWIAAGIAGAVAAIIACARWITSRLIVPRDALHRQYLDDLQADVRDIKTTLGVLTTKQEKQSAELAFLKGLLEGHDGR